MIDKNLLNKSNVEGIFNGIIIQKQEINNISVYRNTLNDYVELHDKSFYPFDIIMIDACNFVKLYGKKIIEANFDSVLFVGLGIGIFPYLSQDNTSIIDVVEINKDIINICNNIGHLKSNVNIINADIFTYNTDKQYDLIVFDIWNEEGSLFTEQCDILTSLFTKNLNLNGKIQFPLLDYFSN